MFCGRSRGVDGLSGARWPISGAQPPISKLHQQIITNQTIQIYSHMIHKLENPLSKILIYVFQSERLGAFLEEKPIKRIL